MRISAAAEDVFAVASGEARQATNATITSIAARHESGRDQASIGAL
jgi:hypothetical protein